MRRLFRENLGWKLLSLVIAAALWYAVVGEPDHAASVSAPLEFSNVPADLEISSEKPPTINLDLQGPAGQLDQADLSGVIVVLDLRSIQKPCERTFTLSAADVRMPAGVKFVKAVPSQVRLTFDRRMTRDVPVRARFSEAAVGYAIRTHSVQPPKLRVVGPESHVSQVEYAETDPIDLAGVVGEKSFRVGVFVFDSQVRIESVPEVTVKVVTSKRRLPEDR